LTLILTQNKKEDLMKFIVNSTALLRELQKLNGVISSNNTLPILDNFLFDINSNNMTIIASDLETTMMSTISVEADVDGKITIPARILIDTLKTFSNQPLTFIVNTETFGIEMSSEMGNYKLAGQNANEFPKTPKLNGSSITTIKGDILANAINKTLFASGNDELRPVMSGMFCELSTEQITFVATDAHKLVKHTRTDISSNKTASFILPKKPLTILKNNISDDADIKLEFNDTNALFTFNNITIICRLIDGKYPNYEAVIPKENPNKLTIETASLLSSIKRVSIYANKTTHQIRLKIAGSELQITSEDLDFANKAEERLSCQYEGTDMEIGFNSKFVIDMLNNIGAEQISLEMSAPNRAGIILPLDGLEEGENTLMLVMPVMLNN
jgi:DNA polymerase-3 subunit beta